VRAHVATANPVPCPRPNRTLPGRPRQIRGTPSLGSVLSRRPGFLRFGRRSLADPSVARQDFQTTGVPGLGPQSPIGGRRAVAGGVLPQRVAGASAFGEFVRQTPPTPGT